MMKKPRKLRWQLALSMSGTVLIIWGSLMALFTYNTSRQIQSDVSAAITSAFQSIESTWGNSAAHPAVGEGGLGEARLREQLSQSSTTTASRGVRVGIALSLRDAAGTEIARSQIAYGRGQSDVGATVKAWYLQFDSCLDDKGQLDFADWIRSHRGEANGYKLSAPELEESGVSCQDGTTARVTGSVRGDQDLLVKRIELLHPDGSIETVVETSYEGDDLVTLEFKYLSLKSVLDTWGDKHADMKSILADYREAQAILQRESEGVDRSVVTSDGGMRSTGLSEGGQGVITWDYNNFLNTLYQMRWIYGLSLALVLALLFLLSTHLAERVSTPIEELHQAVEGAWKCDNRSPIVEVNALATAFNTAQMKMANDLKREQDLTRAVAHELKTPLAILRSHAEALQEDIDPAKRSAYLNIIMDESDRMAALVGELLDLSRMEAGAERLNREVVDLKTLTERVFARIAELTRVSLNLAPLTVSGDPKLLERAISNYASNALRHCAEGGEICVTLRREGGSAVLTVENDGGPIPPEALPHLWDTFYKADTARTRTGGTGLGLAIVRSIAALHGGSCAAENRPGAVAFTLTLPCVLTNSVV